jgi:hypothetical protein
MSRYEVKVGDSVVTYGFDRPLNEYFAEIKSPATQEMVDDLFDSCEVVVGEMLIDPKVGTFSEKYGSHGNLLSYLTEVGVWDLIPEAHRKAIVSDLSF